MHASIFEALKSYQKEISIEKIGREYAMQDDIFTNGQVVDTPPACDRDTQEMST